MNASHSIKIITKLNRDTKEGNVKWESIYVKPSSLIGSEELMGNVYIAKVLEKKIRLYKYQTKSYHYYEEGTFEWVSQYRLEFIDHRGNPEWTFPGDPAIYDLYETVQYKTSDLDKFLDDYLTDEEENDKLNDDIF